MVQVPGATLEHGPEHSITIQNDLSDAQQAALGTPGFSPAQSWFPLQQSAFD